MYNLFAHVEHFVIVSKLVFFSVFTVFFFFFFCFFFFVFFFFLFIFFFFFFFFQRLNSDVPDRIKPCLVINREL